MSQYTIQRGDTLWGLAKKYGTTVNDLTNLNHISDPGKIYTGNRIEIPSYGGEAGPSYQPAPSPVDRTNPAYEQNAPAYRQSQSVTDLQDKLSGLENSKPADYQSAYSDQIKDLLDKVLNRDFSYDFNADPLYQQYKDQYRQLGDAAMRDTMGNAAALSGGYGNSYAATAGNQAYQSYLGQLNDVIPELYSAAYNQYQDEGNRMESEIGLLRQQDQADYGKYRDNVNDYYNFLNYYNDKYENERNFDYDQFMQEWNEWNANRR